MQLVKICSVFNLYAIEAKNKPEKYSNISYISEAIKRICSWVVGIYLLLGLWMVLVHKSMVANMVSCFLTSLFTNGKEKADNLHHFLYATCCFPSFISFFSLPKKENKGGTARGKRFFEFLLTSILQNFFFLAGSYPFSWIGLTPCTRTRTYISLHLYCYVHIKFAWQGK